MKILQLGKFFPPDIGGIETVMFDIVECLNEQNIQCDVLCSNSINKYQEDKMDSYIVYRTKTYGKYFSTSITPQMIFILKSIISNYDIIHIHLPDPMANLALSLINFDKQKIVIHWHSDIVKQKYILKLYEPLQNWLMKKSDIIIATTPKYIEESKYLQKYKGKCVAIPIGIDPNKLQFDDNLLKTIHSKYKGKKIIFSLGRLAYYKGFDYLIKSALYLDDSYMILIGGTGELKSDLQSIIDNESLNTKVELIGRIEQEELGSYYKACNLFCLPSIIKSEAFGVVQIEAMSFGKPVVATKIEGSGVDWVNQDNESGINVNIKNAELLAKAFEKILKNKDEYNKYSKGALDRFNKLFTRDKMIKDIVKIYKELK